MIHAYKNHPNTNTNRLRSAILTILALLVIAVSISCSSETSVSDQSGRPNWKFLVFIAFLSTVSISAAIVLFVGIKNWIKSTKVKSVASPTQRPTQQTPDTVSYNPDGGTTNTEIDENISPTDDSQEKKSQIYELNFITPLTEDQVVIFRQKNFNVNPIPDHTESFFTDSPQDLEQSGETKLGSRSELVRKIIKLQAANQNLLRLKNEITKEATAILAENEKHEDDIIGLKTTNDKLKQSEQKLREENGNQGCQIKRLEDQILQQQEYLKRQADLNSIKTKYRFQQDRMESLITGVDSTEPVAMLISKIIKHPIDDENEYDVVNGRLSILQDLETAANAYTSEHDAAINKSLALTESAEQSNAGRQVEAIKRILQNRQLSSLSVIPTILEDIQLRVDNQNRPIDPKFYTDIAEYRQYLNRSHPPNVRAVPISVIDMLEGLCKQAQVGEMDVVEGIVEITMDALETVYGKP